jgi:hypothetical protein
MMPLCHEGSDYSGFINNEARRENERFRRWREQSEYRLNGAISPSAGCA